MQPPGYRSYLVRLWLDPYDDGAGQWRGEAEHIQSGRTWRFTSLDALLSLFRAATRPPEAEAPGQPPASAEDRP